MKEVDIRNELHHALQWRGWTPKHWQDGRYIVCEKCGHRGVLKPNVAGRPDTKGEHYSIAVPDAWIEVKAVRGTAFPFSDIRPEQRAYLSDRVERGEQAFLCLGKIMPMGDTRETIASIYVIPWLLWLKAENDAKSLIGAVSIPYNYILYTNKVEVRQPDIVTRFHRYGLERRNRGWHFEEDHPLAVQPEVDIPFFMRNKHAHTDSAQAIPT